jgi:hypothetical protein
VKSPSERFCKNSFDRFIANRLPDSVVSWREVAVKDEPPDFYLIVDGTRYAVEVTKLMQKANVGTKRPLPVKTIRDLLKRFVGEEVESVARDGNYLHGAYSVSFSKPVDDFVSLKRAMQGELLAYIRSTQGLNEAPGKVVYESGRQKCTVRKTNDEESKVTMGGPWISKWEGEVASDVGQLLESSLTEKGYKLRNISGPKVLLLHNKYEFADAETYRSCIPSATTLTSFHTVFLVESNGKGFVLHSQNPKWADR